MPHAAGRHPGPFIIGWDLGTSGNKAGLYTAEGRLVATAFEPYETYHPVAGRHEQEPEAWWKAVVASTRELLREAGVAGSAVEACGASGHSLGVVPVDQQGTLVAERVPIWSDERAKQQAEAFFERVDENRWYTTTGNGFPPHLYGVFKMMWFRDHSPRLFARVVSFLGTKDYVNFRLTGEKATDRSYACGSGLYSLDGGEYVPALIEASGIDRRILPGVVPATTVIGCLTARAAAELGLTRETRVVAGGVDNACMALGAMSYREGRCYAALGSSSWIATSSSRPLLDLGSRPYVFAHVVPDQFTSALSLFSAGTSLEWVLDTLCPRLAGTAGGRSRELYEEAMEAAARAPMGANGLLFDPTLGGGTLLDSLPDRRGALVGLDLATTQDDILRATLEGIALGLRVALEGLRRLTSIEGQLVVVGGGSRGRFWQQILADVLGLQVVKTSVDQHVGSLGAAAVAAVGCGLWDGFDLVDAAHEAENTSTPVPSAQEFYGELYRVFLERIDDCERTDAALARIRSQRSERPNAGHPARD